MSTKASKWSASKKELSLKPVGTDVVQPIPQYTMAPKATPHKKNFFAQLWYRWTLMTTFALLDSWEIFVAHLFMAVTFATAVYYSYQGLNSMVAQSMVQTSKDKVSRVQQGIKSERPRVDPFGGRRKCAPVQKYVAPEERRKTAAINNNIAKIMANRVIHEGGVLKLLKDKKQGANVEEFHKSGPHITGVQTKLRAGQNARRRAKAEAHQALVQKEVNDEIAELEAKRRANPYADAPVKRKPRLPVPSFNPLADDDVAGDFFGTDDEAETDESKKAVDEEADNAQAEAAAKAAAAVSKGKGSKGAAAGTVGMSMPARKSGFRGVTDAKTAALLEADF